MCANLGRELPVLRCLQCGKISVNSALVLDFPVNSASRGPPFNPQVVGSIPTPVIILVQEHHKPRFVLAAVR